MELNRETAHSSHPKRIDGIDHEKKGYQKNLQRWGGGEGRHSGMMACTKGGFDD